MKKVIPGLILFLFMQPQISYSASQDECAGWLCVVVGFSPSECRAPLKAMIKRVTRFKPPLPALSSCKYNGPSINLGAIGSSGSNITSKDGFAALIGARTVCVESVIMRGSEDDRTVCTRTEKRPAFYVKGTSCKISNEDIREPQGCIETKRYVEIYDNGVQMGDTYYF